MAQEPGQVSSPSQAEDRAENRSEAHDGADVQELREGIERTRAEMSQTLDAIQEKISPEHVKEQVKEAVHDATVGRAQEAAHAASEKIGEARDKLQEAAAPAAQAAAQTAREKGAEAVSYARLHPLPLALGVVGVLLLLLRALLRPDDPTETEWE